MTDAVNSDSDIARRARLIVDEFSRLPSWEERYKRLIEKGKSLGDLPEDLKSEDLKVRGCQSQVWLRAHLNSAGRIEFRADSDALIVKGLVAILVDVYSLATPEEILSFPPTFLKDLGFETHLTPSRANGLYAVVRQIVYYATAYRALLKPQG